MRSRTIAICVGAALLVTGCATGREQASPPPVIALTTDQQEAISARLGPPTRHDPDLGSLRFRCEPPDAEIIVNGVTQGLASDFSAPRSLTLTPGPHRIEVRKVGYATFRVEVVIAPEVLETIPINLQPLSPLQDEAPGDDEGQEDVEDT